MSKVRVIIIGCGQRGSGYAQYALEFPEKLQVVGIAEPNTTRRERMAKLYSLPEHATCPDWKDVASKPKFADAVVIATQDKLHCEPAVVFANAGYHILLEKPMATTISECKQIYEAVVKNQVILAVGHVLRYTRLYHKLKEIIDEGTIGEVVSINHMECIGYWHFAHSFVRGNWRNESESCFCLMAKSCHDIDLILAFMNGTPVKQVSSFGSLNHFTKAKKPQEAGSAKNCLDCSFEDHCPYSAKKLYLQSAKQGYSRWPVSVVSDTPTSENVESALLSGPYGRCVYECDNDVVDNQVVAIQFEDGRTANFTMVAFSDDICVRKTRVFGTRGEIVCDGHEIQVFQFEGGMAASKKFVTDEFPVPQSSLSGHFGGDFYLMDAFVSAVAENDANRILSGPKETLDSHLLVFAAEHARRTGQVVDFNEFLKNLPDF